MDTENKIKRSSIEFEGKEYSLESGRFAKFANGSVMVKCGDTMILVTVVASEKELEDVDFLPLQVEYREKMSAAGKFPGGFLKREGKPSDREILTSRLIDRPIRPMIPKGWHYETQIIATVYSAEVDVDPETLGAVGASAALMISDIPFTGPISEVKVGRINGKWLANPSVKQLEQSDIDITVAGTDDSIVMVEGESKEISEDEFIEALEFAHSKIRELNDLQRKLIEQFDVKKREFNPTDPPEELVNSIKDFISEDLDKYVHTVTTKTERHNLRNELLEKSIEFVKEKFSSEEDYDEEKTKRSVAEILNKLEKNAMRQMILDEGKRLDGRGLEDIRKISCEVGLLPRAHGSALFTRGETQSLSTTTLGTKSDEQMIDGLLPTYTVRFILHYNFPPFSTGEVGRIGGVGRREIGHGNLAERALKAMLPSFDEFPYTIRVVSDILESNGSSSMATVCAGSLSLFDAGVPMKKPVAGIAMGLIKEGEKYAVLSDILGDEDFLGDMDFKVAGTEDGITACQMDIKIQGLSVEIMRKALEQARRGRLHILSIMNETLDEPREELSPYAPRFTVFSVPQDKIGAIIGPGGENIRGIIRETGVEINIDDDGKVTIAATSKEPAELAKAMITSQIRNPEEGEIYIGEVKEIREGMGAFVEILPKKQGLLHISQIAHERTSNISEILKVGDKIEVKLLEITPDGKFRLSRKALLPKPEGYEEPANSSDKSHHRHRDRNERNERSSRRSSRPRN
ncbi:MAG: polyribonucleotide nucleotidyltransferase [Candidatus Kapabacteria bacterium]|nr:polyribonucleotide nucleotidyltransferase [Candidatus Kapabacteria bacterium]